MASTDLQTDLAQFVEKGAVPPAPVVISLFGPFQLQVGGVPILNFRSSKSRALLAYLLLAQGRPILRTTLLELLWSGYREKSARSSLRQVLTDLRKICSPFELLHTDYYHVQLTLDPALVQCDVLQFEAYMDACQRHPHLSLATCPLCQQRLRQAAQLYKGAFLTNFPTVDSAPFDQWRLAQQTHYATRFDECITALQLQALLVGNLPQPLTPMLGRTGELAELSTKLLHPTYRCLTLTGPGGIGKTRLALALATAMQSHFPDGAWWVELAALPPAPDLDAIDSGDERVVDQIATVICTALGITLQGTIHPATQLAATLAAKRALLVLDNFEHVSAGVGLILKLLQAAPQLRILVTSRHRLALQAQISYGLQGLLLPSEEETTALTPMNLGQYTALQLFVERAEIITGPLPLDAATLAAVGQICRLLEGSPWGIELAAALLDSQPVAQIAQALAKHYAVLQVNFRDLPARQRSAQAVLLTAWRLLSATEAQTLARCSVFRGGFTEAAAQAITDAAPAVLVALVNKSLLHPSGTDRFTMHELVRQFAAEQLATQAEESATIQARHRHYYFTLLADGQRSNTPLRFRERVQQEIANIEAAWAGALATGQASALLAALPGLTFFYQLACRFHQAEAILAEAVSQVREWVVAEPFRADTLPDQPPQRLLAQLLLKQCELYNYQIPQPTQVIGPAQELIQWGESWGMRDYMAEGYIEWSIALTIQGHLPQQRQLLDQAQPLIDPAQTPRLYAKWLFSLGLYEHNQRNFATALAHQQQALALAQYWHEPLLTLRLSTHMAMVYRDTGDWGQALHYYQQHLQLAEQLDQRNEVAYATANLGIIRLRVGDFAQARLYLEAALHAFTEQGDKRLMTELKCVLAMLFQQIGATASAIDHCQQAITLATTHHYYHAHRSALITLAELWFEQGKIAEATATYQQVIDLMTNTGNPTELYLVYPGLAMVRQAQQEPSAAVALVELALTHYGQEQLDDVDQPAVLLNCYQVLAANDDPRAPAVLQQAWQSLEQQARKISDPTLRTSFLTNVPINRTLRQLVQPLS